MRGAFAVDRAEALEVTMPFVAELRRGGDVVAYAAACTGFLRKECRTVEEPTANAPSFVPRRLPMAMVLAEAGGSLVGVTARGAYNGRAPPELTVRWRNVS